MRLFLGAHQTGLAGARVEQPGLLFDHPAVLEDIDLALGLVADRLHDKAHRIDVLDLAPGAQFAARFANRNIDVGAHRALLHIAVARADIAQDGPKFPDIGPGLFRGPHVGPGDDLHQRDPGAVEIDKGFVRVLVVQRLAGVLLQMEALNSHLLGFAVRKIEGDHPLAHHRVLELGNLVALRQVGVKIVLAVEHRALVDPGAERQPGSDRLPDTFAVDHRQHPGHRRIDQADVIVGGAAEIGRRAGKQLGFRDHLGMDLEADDHLPIAGGALDNAGMFFHGAILSTRHRGPR